MGLTILSFVGRNTVPGRVTGMNMSNQPDPLMRDEDSALLRDLIKATESNAAQSDRILLATMAANIASGMLSSTGASEFVVNAACRNSIRLAKMILAEIDGES